MSIPTIKGHYSLSGLYQLANLIKTFIFDMIQVIFSPLFWFYFASYSEIELERNLLHVEVEN